MVTPSAVIFASISLTSSTCSSPFGPFTFTVRPSSVAVTPFGSGIILFPIRDIACVPLEHLTEDFAADILFAGGTVRHHALRRRDDGKAQSAAVRLQFDHRGVYAPTRRRNPLQIADDGAAFMIFELDLEFAFALELDLRIAADETFSLQH